MHFAEVGRCVDVEMYISCQRGLRFLNCQIKIPMLFVANAVGKLLGDDKCLKAYIGGALFFNFFYNQHSNVHINEAHCLHCLRRWRKFASLWKRKNLKEGKKSKWEALRNSRVKNDELSLSAQFVAILITSSTTKGFTWDSCETQR